MIKSLIIVLLTVNVAWAVGPQAFWTGQSRQVTTMSGMPGWQCEYDYLGQRFWIVTRNFCPSWISVQ